ncbi:MAG TPA: MTH938/NDUFAF3 family protein [Anaerolineae bacterium]
MRPRIEDNWFGSITVDGVRYEHDIIIRLSGRVRKRKKVLSKEMYGTSHKISLAEILELYRPSAERLIVGTGHEDQVRLSPEAIDFLAQHQVHLTLLPTPKAVKEWNQAEGYVLALFHITC